MAGITFPSPRPTRAFSPGTLRKRPFPKCPLLNLGPRRSVLCIDSTRFPRGNTYSGISSSWMMYLQRTCVESRWEVNLLPLELFFSVPAFPVCFPLQNSTGKRDFYFTPTVLCCLWRKEQNLIYLDDARFAWRTSAERICPADVQIVQTKMNKMKLHRSMKNCNHFHLEFLSNFLLRCHVSKCLA